MIDIANDIAFTFLKIVDHNKSRKRKRIQLAKSADKETIRSAIQLHKLSAISLWNLPSIYPVNIKFFESSLCGLQISIVSFWFLTWL